MYRLRLLQFQPNRQRLRLDSDVYGHIHLGNGLQLPSPRRKLQRNFQCLFQCSSTQPDNTTRRFQFCRSSQNSHWNASAESGGSISQYSIERCTGLGCSNFSQIATTSGTSYTDTSAAAGTTYNYRVRAQDSNGFYGPYSTVVTASIPAYFDNAADGGNNGGNTASLTYSYTVGTNSNRLLLVNLVGDPSVDDISSVTYAGVL